MLPDSQEDEQQAYADHHQMLPGRVRKSGELPELLQAVDNCITHAYAILAISAPSRTESVFLT